MGIRIKKEKFILLILVFLLLGLYSLDRTRLSHSIPDEKRYIQSTKEMIAAGDYITPLYHNKLRFQKPILFYWLILLSYKAFGVSVYGARFPSITAGVLTVILTYLIGKLFFGKKTGLFAALALSTSEVFFMYSRFASPDVVFVMFITASLYLFALAYFGRIKGRFKYIYMYAFMAFAMITKGPLGIIYPLGAISLFLILRGEPEKFKEINLLSGMAVFFLISAPWFIIMALRHGDAYIDKVWTLEILKKLKYATSGSESNVLVIIFGNLLFYSGMVLVRHLPWSAFLPAAIASGRHLKSTSADEYRGKSLVFAWFLSVFILLSLVWSKESYYVLTLSVPFSLFIGRYLSALTEEKKISESLFFKFPFFVFIAFFTVALVLWNLFAVYALGKGVPAVSFALFTIPIFMLYAFFKRKTIYLVLSLFVLAVSAFGYVSGYVIPTVYNDPLIETAEELKAGISIEDEIGVASSGVSRHRLNTVFENHKLVRADKWYYMDDGGKKYSHNKRMLINRFLQQKDRRVYCFIKKDDYAKYVDEDIKDSLHLVKTTSVWKKFHKKDALYFRRMFSYIKEDNREAFRRELRDVVYVITNRERETM